MLRNQTRSSGGSAFKTAVTWLLTRPWDGTLTVSSAFRLLLLSRFISALYNIIHDCDEVYNYWEPLHYWVYGYGMQTWEYSAKFALRSWLYILLHGAIAKPLSWIFGTRGGKVLVFYSTKAVLGFFCAWCDRSLYSAVASRYKPFLANSFLFFSVISSGMFVSSTSFLPSSFAMYAVTMAAAQVLRGRPRPVVFLAIFGVTLGWTVAAVAFFPYALWVIAQGAFWIALRTALISLGVILLPLIFVDRMFYGVWTVSLWNFIHYNVIGGGQSALYGIEPPTYYLRNGFNQLQLVLPLALILPLVAAATSSASMSLQRQCSPSKITNGERKGQGLAIDGQLLWAVAPAAVWMAAISYLPHKEERFLYVVYPLLCLAAAATLESITNFMSSLIPILTPIARAGALSILFMTALVSISRSAALVSHYGAAYEIYRALPSSANATTVCVGAEWHRYPSSFFLPGPGYRLQFIDSGFDGLLPRAFLEDGGRGARSAPTELNDENRAEPRNYWTDTRKCDYAVTLVDQGSSIDRLLDKDTRWSVVKEVPFVDNQQSPKLSRALYIPWGDENYRVAYTLLQRK